jgi:hypothetical protein
MGAILSPLHTGTGNAHFKAYAKVEAEGKVQAPPHLPDGTPSAGGTPFAFAGSGE